MQICPMQEEIIFEKLYFQVEFTSIGQNCLEQIRKKKKHGKGIEKASVLKAEEEL